MENRSTDPCYPSLNDQVDPIASRLESISTFIGELSPDPARVKVIAVSKTVSVDTMLRAYKLGIRHFGENYAGELEEKHNCQEMSLPEVTWHYIGQIQSNKIKRLSGLVDFWHSVSNRPHLERLVRAQDRPKVFIQVNLDGFGQELNSASPRNPPSDKRQGVDPSELDNLVNFARSCNCDLVGLMGVGPGLDQGRVDEAFSWMGEMTCKYGFSELSLGMSGDFKSALRHGSTMIRLGEAIFGRRANPASLR